jgi:hypothetical protein
MILLFLIFFILATFNFHVKTLSIIKKAFNLGIYETYNLPYHFGLKPNRYGNYLKEMKIALKSSKGIFFLFLLKASCLVPILIVSTVDFDQKWPSIFRLYSWIFFRLSAALSPIIYPFYYSSFKHGYKNMYNRLVYGKRSIRIRKKKELRNKKIQKYIKVHEISIKNFIKNHIEI